MYPNLIGEPNLKSSAEKVKLKRLKICDKRSMKNSYLDCRPVAKAQSHSVSKFKDSTSGKPQESSMKRKLEELHSLFSCAQESIIKNTAVGTHLQGSTPNSCYKNASKIDSTHLAQPGSLVNSLENKHEKFLLPASVVTGLPAKNISLKKLSSCDKKSNTERVPRKQNNLAKKFLDKEECLPTAEKMEYCKLHLEKNCFSIPSGQSLLHCSTTNSYKEDDFKAHLCRALSPNCNANYCRKKMRKIQSSDSIDLQTPSETFFKENFAPNSSFKYMSTESSSKTCTIVSAKPQDFHHRLKKQFTQLHSSFFPSQDLYTTSSTETSSLLSLTKNLCKFNEEKALVGHFEDVPGPSTDSKSVIELNKIKSPVAQTSASAKTTHNSISSEVSSLNSMDHNDLARAPGSNLEKKFLTLSSNIHTQRQNEHLTQEPSLDAQQYKNSTKIWKKSNSESSLDKYAFSLVKKLSTCPSSQKSDSFESNLKTVIADQEKHSIIRSKENEEHNSFPSLESSAGMQHCNLCSEPSSLTQESLKNMQCENSHGEYLEKETYELSEDQCEVFFSSVTEWKKFMPSPISCGSKSSDLHQGSADRKHHSTELALANEESNLLSIRQFLPRPEKFEYLHQNKNHDFELGFEKNHDSESEKSKDSLYCKNQFDFANTKKNSMSTSGRTDNLHQRKAQFNNEIESKSKPLSIDCEIPFLTIKKPEPENQTNVTNAVQLLIMDLLNVTPTTKRRYFMFHNVVIHHVDVFGIITGVRPVGNDKIIYEVDDGSGTISCMHQISKLEARLRKFEGFLNLNRSDETFDQTEVTIMNQSSAEQSSEQDAAFKELKTCMENHFIKSSEDLFYKIGDTVHATGVLYDFRGTISFYIYDIRKVMNVAEEIDRYQEMAILYHSIYPKTIDLKS